MCSAMLMPASPVSCGMQGIKQYVPEPGAGFPEDFVPFRNLDTIVQARYPKKKKA